jgi:predicted GNAT family N-acyltransferase
MSRPKIGASLLRKALPDEAYRQYEVRLVRDPTDFLKVAVVRAATYMAEQTCPYEEEFDGNDFCSTHVIALDGNNPVGTLRLRWFAGFAKLERVCVLPAYRGTPVVKMMLAECFEIASRKGYERMIGQIQSRLWPLWSHVFRCRLRSDRPAFFFSDFEYVEVDIPLPAHPNAIRADQDPLVIIRPEGAWDEPGILERSLDRLPSKPAAA